MSAGKDAYEQRRQLKNDNEARRLQMQRDHYDRAERQAQQEVMLETVISGFADFFAGNAFVESEDTGHGYRFAFVRKAALTKEADRG